MRSALRQAEQTLVTRVAARLDPGAIGRLEALVGLEDEADVDRPDALATGQRPLTRNVHTAAGEMMITPTYVTAGSAAGDQELASAIALVCDLLARGRRDNDGPS